MIETTTVAGLLAERGRLHPRRVMYRLDEDTITYGEMAETAAAVARGLLGQGIGPGSRLGIVAEQTLEAWQLLMGCAVAGVVPVLVNWRLAPPEVDFILADAGCVAVVATPRFADLEGALTVPGELRRAPLPAFVADLIAAGSSTSAPVDLPDIAPGDDLVQLYTSGTTGLPKGVRTSNAAMLSLLAALDGELAGFAADSIHLVAAPLFHIAGYGYGLAGLPCGAAGVLVPMFDPDEVGRVIETYRCTNGLLVPAMLQAVVEHPGSAARDFSSVRGLLYGASPISVALIRRVVDLIGCRLTQAYGLTETTGLITFLRWDDHEAGLAELAAGSDGSDGSDGSVAVERLASAGYPFPGCEVEVVDESGSPCADGVPGEVVARSPLLMSGYWNRPDTRAVDDDGWFHSGDIGYLSDGYLFLVDRLDDKIVTKGENVFPGEVERVLGEHPAVLEVAVIGVPDEAAGEALTAVVVLREAATLTLEEAQEHCRGQLAGFKLPRRLVQSEQPLPRTPSGKILRRTVREPYWAGHDRRVN